MDRKLKILIVGSFCFPFGSASASRIRTIAKGLIASGARVHVITNIRILTIENNCSTDALVYDRITYESTNLSEGEARKSSRLNRVYNNILSTKKCRKRVEYYIKNEGFDVVYIYGRSAIKNIPLVWDIKKAGASIFYDMVEWLPSKAFKYGLLNPFYYDDLLGRLISPIACNGIIAITTYISNRYILFKTPCIVVPSVFENTTVSLVNENKTRNETEGFIIVYAGACKAGDGFGRLLDAIKIAVARGCLVKLKVIGTDGNSGRALYYKKICEKMNALGIG